MRSMLKVLSLFVTVPLVLILGQDVASTMNEVPSPLSSGSAQEVSASETANPPRLVLGNLNMDLTIEGHPFRISFAPERQSAEEVATQLCTEKATEIGVTSDNFNLCVNRVGQLIQSNVNQWIDEKIVRFPLTIQNTEFSLSFIPEMKSAKEMANELCLQYANTSQTVFENENDCIVPAAQYIQQRINSFFIEKTMELPLTINGLRFDIRMIPERQSPLQVATRLCLNYAAQLNVSAENVETNCIVPVGNSLADRVEIWTKSKILDFNFKVGEKPYSVSFIPERTSSQQVARTFCLQNANDFALTNENFMTNCVQPINEFISQTIKNWINDKRVTVPLEIKGKPVNVVFFPEREHILYVAENVCREQVTNLGLTEETFQSNCVNPVMRHLSESIQSWISARKPEQPQQQAQSAANA